MEAPTIRPLLKESVRVVGIGATDAPRAPGALVTVSQHALTPIEERSNPADKGLGAWPLLATAAVLFAVSGACGWLYWHWPAISSIIWTDDDSLLVTAPVRDAPPVHRSGLMIPMEPSSSWSVYAPIDQPDEVVSNLPQDTAMVAGEASIDVPPAAPSLTLAKAQGDAAVETTPALTTLVTAAAATTTLVPVTPAEAAVSLSVPKANSESDVREPADTPTPAASAPVIVPAVDRETSALLIRRGDEFLANSDVSSARLFYRRAADAGNAAAALAMAKTFDPVALVEGNVHGIHPEPTEALQWYRRAIELGASDAKLPEQRLIRDLQQAAANGDADAVQALAQPQKN